MPGTFLDSLGLRPAAGAPACAHPAASRHKGRTAAEGRIEIGSRCRRRKQNSSTPADGRSSHRASSTATTSGAPPEKNLSASRIPRASIRRSGSGRPAQERSASKGPGDASRSRATSTARLRGPGSTERTSPATSPSRSSSAEKASGLSARAARHDSTLDDRPAAWSTCCHITVLPIPASPVITSAAGAPKAAERNAARLSAISASRPTGLESTCHPQSGLAHPSSGENPPRRP